MSEVTDLAQQYLAQARWYRYFQQDERWWPNGRPPVRIADMDDTWRYNASRWLVREATRLAALFVVGCGAEILWVDLHVTAEMAHDGLINDLEWESELARRDPAVWMVQTPLHRALVADLPGKGAPRRKLAARASHWTGCPGRESAKAKECRCTVLATEHARLTEVHGRPKG